MNLVQNRPLSKNQVSLVDLEAPPSIPPGWSVLSHRVGSPILTFHDHFNFYVSRPQAKAPIPGHELRKDLEDKPVVNANVLDYLLRELLMDPRYLPDRWKYDMHDRARYIFFWGTIYLQDGEPCVRCLHWNNHHWESSFGWLSSLWNSYYQSLLHP